MHTLASPSPIPVIILDTGPTVWQWWTQFWIPILGILATIAVATVAGILTAQLARRDSEEKARRRLKREAAANAREAAEAAERAAEARARRVAFQTAAARYIEHRVQLAGPPRGAVIAPNLDAEADACGPEARPLLPWLAQSGRAVDRIEMANNPANQPEIDAMLRTIEERVARWVESGMFDATPLVTD